MSLTIPIYESLEEEPRLLITMVSKQSLFCIDNIPYDLNIFI